MVDIQQVVGNLSMIEEDNSVPKNVRSKIRDAIGHLENGEGKSEEMVVDQVLQQLDELSSDPNLPAYTRTQIWEVVSTLESK